MRRTEKFGGLLIGAVSASLFLVSCSGSIEPQAAPSPSGVPSNEMPAQDRGGDAALSGPRPPLPLPSSSGERETVRPNPRETGEASADSGDAVPASASSAKPETEELRQQGVQESPAATPAAPDTRPSYAGLSLGMSVNEVIGQLGSPNDRYPIADRSGNVQMHEYDGLTVGYDASGAAVYIEITAASVPTGIEGLTVGQAEARAAEALGIDVPSDSNVLQASAAQGWVKADIDPSTRTVLSVKWFKQN
ncbi:hypothetical protein [Cohnella massiliensis]|uniref:hypothetical protein n=1 Tax=Cohnella massiliensis TaxID=1816691 RepID=UPI0009BA89B3|nr:hypothetical protein [Cohnella massiliensis]